MATITISITQEAYARLAALRKGNESFSQIINRVTGKRDLTKFIGVLSKRGADNLERDIKRFRSRVDKDMRTRVRRWSKELH